MESLSAHDVDRRLAELVRSERNLAVQFVVELAGFAKRELYRELGYTSLFYYCVRQLGLSKSSAFRRSEAARIIVRLPGVADWLLAGRLSIRALVELRDVLTEENHVEVLRRAEGMSEEQAQLLAVEYRPKPVPRDVVRALPGPAPFPVPIPVPIPGPNPPAGAELVPAGTNLPSRPSDVVKPLTPNLRRLNVTVSSEFIDELEQVRAALSHKYPDGNFQDVVRESFKLVLERDRKRKALTNRPRQERGAKARNERDTKARKEHLPPPNEQNNEPYPEAKVTGENARYVPAAVKRAVWKRDQGRCTWPMGDGKRCGSTHRLEFDHDLEVALGGKPTLGNIQLLCKGHNLMKAEQHLGKAVMTKFRKHRGVEQHASPSG